MVTRRLPSLPLQVALLAALAVVVRAIHLGSAPAEFDEFYHILAARSWLAEGTFAVGGGEYSRSSLFTLLVAGSMRLLGDGLAAARIPSVLAGVAWVVAMFLWTRKVAGTTAAWIGGIVFSLDPGVVHLSQLARFYTLHGLAVWLGAVGIYRLVREDMSRPRVRLVVVGVVVAWVLALHLQVTTLAALAAVCGWLAAALGPRLRAMLSRDRRAVIVAIVIVGVALVGLAYGFADGTLARLWLKYQVTPSWAEQTAGEPRYYAWWLEGRYPILWALFPAAVVVALVTAGPPAAFATTVFAISFLVQSLGAAKNERYLYYAFPFFLAVWSFALATAFSGLRRLLDELLLRVRGLERRVRLRSAATGAATAGIFLFAYRTSPAVSMTADMLRAEPGKRPYAQPDYASAAPKLRLLTDSADVVVTTAMVKSLYYLDRGDVALSRTVLSDLARPHMPPDFFVDPRTGRPVITEPASLERVYECYRTGLVLVEAHHLRTPWIMPAATARFLETRLEEVTLQPAWGLRAFKWRRASLLNGDHCRQIERTR
ncbi:MAG TPA: hypothetical protein VFM14_19475 [Gemmatimonadales bacterium]|nr:hypothetical protein [Gemmatimonadales bacterium]